MIKNYLVITLYMVLRKLYRKLILIRRNYLEKKLFDRTLLNWIKFNHQKFSNKITKDRFIFSDVFMVPEWLFVNSYALDIISNNFNLKKASFSETNRSFKENKVYNSLGIENHFIVSLNTKNINEHYRLFNNAKKNILTKDDLFAFEVDNINIGVEIYESILRTGLPTVKIDSAITWRYVYIGLKYFLYFKDLLDKNKIGAFVLSHDIYIYMGIPAKLGYRFGIKTYLINPRDFYCLSQHEQMSERFIFFPKIFKNLSSNEKVRGLEWSKNVLHKRLNGQVGAEMSYQIKSAFTFEKVTNQILDNNKLNVVIATHEFYDNPHAYGGLLFLDFYEWLLFLVSVSNETDYNWYLKPHRDADDSELKHLRTFAKKYNNFILLNPDYTFHQLLEDGVNIALTCYGSIGHELPLLGFKVINAGNNPHIAYNFNYNPIDIDDYRQILLRLNQLKIDVDKNEIYEFFYIYKKYFQPYDFTLNKLVTIRNNESIFKIFIDNNIKFEKEIYPTLNNFIVSNNTYSFQNLTNV
jgi:hypothetical protein